MTTINQLSLEDLNVIRESLTYTKLKFEDYQSYPSYEYKLKRINDVSEVLAKINTIIKDKKK